MTSEIPLSKCGDCGNVEPVTDLYPLKFCDDIYEPWEMPDGECSVCRFPSRVIEEGDLVDESET
jgi:hypothetical protein